MIPDVRTLWMVLSLTALLFGLLEMWVGFGKKRDTAMILWGLANLAGSLGTGLISARDLVPYEFSVSIGNSLLVAFLGLIWAGQRSFAGQRIAWLPVVVAPVALAIAYQYIPPFPDDTVARIYLVTLMVVAFFVLIAVNGFRANRSEPLVMRRVLATVCAVAAFPTAWRAVNAGLDGGPIDLMSASAVTAVPMLALIVLVIAINVCLLLIQRERLENQLAYAATTDSLTGTLNRSGFLDRAQDTAERCAGQGRLCSIVVMDLDEFKSINDLFGHAAGDQMLAGFAATARGILRSEDLLGRTGGEEFCALLPGATELEAVDVANRIREAFATSSFEHLDKALKGTVSMGVASVVAREGLGRAIQRADLAMYNAKSNGRDRVARAD